MQPDGSINPGEMTSFNYYALGAVADWVLLRIRNRSYRRICEQEDADTDQDGIPDIYQPDHVQDMQDMTVPGPVAPDPPPPGSRSSAQPPP